MGKAIELVNQIEGILKQLEVEIESDGTTYFGSLFQGHGCDLVAGFEVDSLQLPTLSTWLESPETIEELKNQFNAAVMGLAGESGEVTDLIKKWLFKPGYVLDRDKLINELGDVWYYLRIMTILTGVSIEELTKLNAEKLKGGHGWKSKPVKNEFEVSWDDAPEWANYHAFDKNGAGYFWENRPTVGCDDVDFVDILSGDYLLGDSRIKSCNWKNSITERPKSPEVYTCRNCEQNTITMEISGDFFYSSCSTCGYKEIDKLAHLPNSV